MMLMCSCQGTSFLFHEKHLAGTGNGGATYKAQTATICLKVTPSFT